MIDQKTVKMYQRKVPISCPLLHHACTARLMGIQHDEVVGFRIPLLPEAILTAVVREEEGQFEVQFKEG